MKDKVRTINALLIPFNLHHLPVFVLSFPFFFKKKNLVLKSRKQEKKEEDKAQHMQDNCRN
jgi:hypothetical protein